ncbi:hypothetical protein OIU76_021121 [Salix suchowensis]|nr:hypothetical protein OIU76_021121 [Salix suchowensis]
MVAVNNNIVSSSKPDDEMEENQTLQKDKNDCLMVSDTFHKKAPDKISTGRSTSISAEELSMVLKHYGLDCQDENEKHLPAETYFGSARHWISSATGG